MLDSYLNWPRQVEFALETWNKYSVSGEFDEIACIGMGGSGIVCDYLQVLSTEYKGLPVYVSKSHITPGFIDENTLTIVISYSGNTIETLLALKGLLKKKTKIVSLSSGGLLAEESRRNNILHVLVPAELTPRASLPVMLYSLLGLLDASGYSIVSRKTAEESLVFLENNIEKALVSATSIVEWMRANIVNTSRLPVIATHSPLEPLAIRGKNEFGENSKIIVKIDIAPEWMHNDIVGYEYPTIKELGILEIVDPSNLIGVKLVDFMRNMYLSHDTVYYRLELKGYNMLEKLIYGSLVLGLTSVKLGEIRGIDPAKTPSIVQYKKSAESIFTSVT